MKGASGTAGDTGDSRVAVNVRVRVYPGTHGDVRGTVVEDFGDLAGHLVDIGENHFVGPARRWAVALDMGGAPGRMRVAHKCRKCQEETRYKERAEAVLLSLRDNPRNEAALD